MPTPSELATQELARRYSLRNRTQVPTRYDTVSAARPTIRSALGNLMRDAIDATGVGGGYRQGLLNAAEGVETAADFLPVVGDVLGLEDASRAYGQGDLVGTGINLMGVIPLIGDAGVKISQKTRSALRDAGFTEGFFHASKQDIKDGFRAGYSDGMVFVTPDREFANNWVGKGKHQERIGEDLYDMEKADKQAIFDSYASRYGDFDNWPEAIKDEYWSARLGIHNQYRASGGTIYPVAVRANNQFDPEENPEIISEFLTRRGQDPLGTTLERGKTDLEVYQQGNYLLFENKEMADFLKEKGYDSVWLRENTTRSGLENPFSTLAILDETGVKPVYDFARESDAASSALRGLDISQEARMQRAQDLGFDMDNVFYHGTSSDFSELQPSTVGDLGAGVYVTPNPEKASGYAAVRKFMKRQTNNAGPNVLPLRVRGNLNYLDLQGGSIMPFDEARIQSLKDQGYDGIRQFDAEGNVIQMNIFDPKNIRSINAEFDPTKADSADLLSSVGTTSALRNIA